MGLLKIKSSNKVDTYRELLKNYSTINYNMKNDAGFIYPRIGNIHSVINSVRLSYIYLVLSRVTHYIITFAIRLFPIRLHSL